MKKTITQLGIASLAFFPIIASAQEKNLNYIVGLVINAFNVAVYLIIALAFLMFVWNVFRYFIKGGDNVGEKKEAGQYVLWSVVGFFVILSIWGIVNILTNTFKLDSNKPAGFFGTFTSSPFERSSSNVQYRTGSGPNDVIRQR